MMFNMIFVSVLFLTAALSAGIPARGDEITVEHVKIRTLGWVLKSSLKACLQNGDFAALKQQKLAEIKRMDERTFSAQYAAAWPVLKNCPALVTRYRLTQNMTRERALKIVDCLTLHDCLEAVDSIPDEVMVEQFERCVDNPEDADKPLKEQVDSIMARWLPKK